MITLSPKQQTILAAFFEKDALRSSEAHEWLRQRGEDISLVTVKRALSAMARSGVLAARGSGRSTSYALTAVGRMFADIDASAYCSIEPDARYGRAGYNFDLLSALPAEVFTAQERRRLERATKEYRERTRGLSSAIRKKELERLVIELSWKSSKIEGNTYTLLDTEKLILEGAEASGHPKEEARMILNHKDAFYYVRENARQFKTLNRKNLEELHAILVKGLRVGRGLRKRGVGIVGSRYRPLDNLHQITDAVRDLSSAVSRADDGYAKALLTLLGVSYIQPFEDGNKRTARMAANALLVAHSLAPLSYRSVAEQEYREAMLVWYELNSFVPFAKLFVEQYEFAATQYAAR